MKKSSIIVASIVAAAGTSASGQLQIFTDQAAWENAVANAGFTPIEETFDGIEINNMQPSNSPHVVNDDFSISVEGTDSGNDDDAFIADGQFHGEIFPDQDHTGYRHDFNNEIVAFGQFFEGAASGLGVQIASDLGTLDIFDDGGLSGFEDGFLGFLADSGSVSSVTIIGSDADGGSAVGEIYDANNVTYAFVPAPGTAALLGLGGLAAIRRRR